MRDTQKIRNSFGVLVIWIFICTIFLTFNNAAAKTENKTIKLKLSGHGPSVGLTERILQKWAEAINEKSEGRVTIECFFGGTLASAGDARAAVEMGVVDIGFAINAETPSRVPASLFLGTPLMGFANSDMATIIWNDLFKTNALVQKDFHTAKVLMLWMGDARYIHTAKKPIVVPDDVKGMKMLAWGSAAKSLELLGGSSIQMPPPDWFMALDRGLTEGIITSPRFVDLFKIEPKLKFHTYGLDLGYNGFALLMNKDSWSSLPPDIQEFMENELNPETIKEFVKTEEEVQNKLRSSFESDGHQIVEPTSEQKELWNAAIQPLYEEIITDNEKRKFPAREYYKQVKEMIKNFKSS